MNNPGIELKNVTKKFKDFVAVNDVTFSVYQNEIFGLIGPNGAGKTTLIKMLSGLYQQDSGSIKILNFDIDKDIIEIRKRIGIMLDDPPLFDYLTTYESLVLHSKMHQIPENIYKERIENLLENFYLRDERNKLVNQLSLGNRKKLAFALSILHNPQILFIDEPLINVDVLTVNVIKEVIKKFSEKGCVFLTSHILPLVEELCNKIAIINQGKIIFCGTIDELKKEVTEKETTLDKIFLKVLNIDERKDILSWIK